MREAVLYDFHGTLADVSTVLPYLETKDYDGFYTASLSCPPITGTVSAAQWSSRAGYANLLFTGLPHAYAEGLTEWLTRYAVPVDFLLMRPDGDFRKDFIVKHEMYMKAVEQGFRILRAWDDSPAVLDLWRHQGIPVVPVARPIG